MLFAAHRRVVVLLLAPVVAVAQIHGVVLHRLHGGLHDLLQLGRVQAPQKVAEGLARAFRALFVGLLFQRGRRGNVGKRRLLCIGQVFFHFFSQSVVLILVAAVHCLLEMCLFRSRHPNGLSPFSNFFAKATKNT